MPVRYRSSRLHEAPSAMDCQTVRQLIEMSPRGVPGLRSADGEAVRHHLETCPQCQSAAAEIGEWDHRVRTVMTAVPVPAGFREQLLSQLTKSAPQMAALAGEARPVSRSYWRVATGLGLCIALATGIAFWIGLPSKLQLASIEDSSVRALRNHPAAGLSNFDGSFPAEITDAKWQKVCTSPPVGLNLDNRSGHDVAAFRVNIPALRFRGWLVLVPISRIADVPLSTYPDSVHYAQTAAWQDGKYVLICLAEQGSIETLVAQWNGSAA